MSSRRNAKRTAATMISLSSLSAGSKKLSCVGGSPDRCQIIFDHYDQCMSESSVYGSERCDYLHEQMASCPGYKRVPGHLNVFEESKKEVESLKKKAIAEGFLTLNDYFDHRFTKTPHLCAAAYRLYNECMRDEAISEKSICALHRHKCCPQFKNDN